MAYYSRKVIGRAIFSLRRAAHLTQEDVAYESDISVRQIARIEKGVVDLRLSALYRIADALEIKPQDILDRAEEL